MSEESAEGPLLEDLYKIVDDLAREMNELTDFRDCYFENHPFEEAENKNKLLTEKRNALLEKFESIDVDSQIPTSLRPKFLYLKGRCLNILPAYDPEAIACLSKAVKLNPHLIEVWNELGECHWKNLNIKDAKASFEGALAQKPNPVSLRCLSIIMRQEIGGSTLKDASATILQSVKFARDAINLNPKDGLSWSVLGNAYLCQYFMVAQEPATLKSCMTAYKQAYKDPVARGQPDLYYNRGIALKYSEDYSGALENFEKAYCIDPPWEPPREELKRLKEYLVGVNDLVNTKGKIKPKKLQQMLQSLDKKLLGPYLPEAKTSASQSAAPLELTPLSCLKRDKNEGKVVLAKVLGSIHTHNSVPFTFVIIDESDVCFVVTVYNWANGRGAIIGDSVAIPEPIMEEHSSQGELAYNFKSIRVNNPLSLVLNGKPVSRNQFARTKVTSTYEIQ